MPVEKVSSDESARLVQLEDGNRMWLASGGFFRNVFFFFFFLIIFCGC